MRSSIDRLEQLDAIQKELREPTRAGVLVVGAAGAGKTHLADRAIELLERDRYAVRRLHGAGRDDVPMGAVSRAFTDDETYSGIASVVSMKRVLESSDQPTVFMIDDVNELDPSGRCVDRLTSPADRLRKRLGPRTLCH